MEFNTSEMKDIYTALMLAQSDTTEPAKGRFLALSERVSEYLINVNGDKSD